MADAYWRYGDGRPQQAALAPLAVKRPRPDFEMPTSHELPNYYAHPDDKASLHVTRDTDSINASYDRYLRNTQMSSHGNDTGRPVSTVLGGPRHVDDPHVMTMGGSDLAVATMSRPVGARGRSELKLPLDASSTLYVEGLPTNCSRREVSHIFRPFVGYKEVRLVTKEPRQSGGDSMVLCFVDFVSPAHAATAMDALQGYKFDEHDRESAILRLQFARYPGARSGAGNRGKR